MAESLVQKQVRLVLEKQCSEIGRVIADALPAGVGFCFVTFDFGPANSGNMAYLSNGERKSTVKMLRELLEKIEREASHSETVADE